MAFPRRLDSFGKCIANCQVYEVSSTKFDIEELNGRRVSSNIFQQVSNKTI